MDTREKAISYIVFILSKTHNLGGIFNIFLALQKRAGLHIGTNY